LEKMALPCMTLFFLTYLYGPETNFHSLYGLLSSLLVNSVRLSTGGYAKRWNCPSVFLKRLHRAERLGPTARIREKKKTEPGPRRETDGGGRRPSGSPSPDPRCAGIHSNSWRRRRCSNPRPPWWRRRCLTRGARLPGPGPCGTRRPWPRPCRRDRHLRRGWPARLRSRQPPLQAARFTS
jgi:hypothetical protein